MCDQPAPLMPPFLHRGTLFIICLGLAMAAWGCAQGHRRVESDYSTVEGDLRRDTERARRENARGLQLIDESNWDAAEKAFKSALTADLTFGPAHNNLGRVYYRQGKMYLAAWEFQYAVKTMPYRPESKNNLGLVLEAAGRLDDAIRQYDAAIELEHDNPMFLGNSARARVRRGDHDARTVELLEQVSMWDERADWSAWAKERLVMSARKTSTSQPSK